MKYLKVISMALPEKSVCDIYKDFSVESSAADFEMTTVIIKRIKTVLNNSKLFPQNVLNPQDEYCVLSYEQFYVLL